MRCFLSRLTYTVVKVLCRTSRRLTALAISWRESSIQDPMIHINRLKQPAVLSLFWLVL